MNTDHEKYMREALKEARRAWDEGEIPIGAVVVCEGRIIARAHRVPVAFFEYLFSALLALVVMFSVWGVGVLLVTAMLTVPAASARNFARTAGGMFWWAIVVGTSSAVAGLALSVQPWMGTATGATIILVSCFWFLMSVVAASVRNERQF